jgi:hypothetical protein
MHSEQAEEGIVSDVRIVTFGRLDPDGPVIPPPGPLLRLESQSSALPRGRVECARAVFWPELREQA